MNNGIMVWVLLILMGFAHAAETAKASDDTPPNIIFIMTDDQGYLSMNHLGGRTIKGEPFHTPNLDKLATESMSLSNCHSRAMCAPTREVLMTGKGLYHPGVQRTPAMDLPWVSQILQDAGYVTGISGKWMLGTLNPMERGYDEAFIWGGHYDYWEPKIVVFNSGGYMKELNQPEGISIDTDDFDIPPGGGPGHGTILKDKYGPDLINRFACDFITRHADENFFLYYPMKLIHVPYHKMPDGKAGNGSRYIEYADSLIQNIIETVDSSGIKNNTIIMVTSDNGFSWQDQVKVADGVEKFPGSKGSALEGSTREFFIARWPGMIQPGSTYEGLVDFTDMLPTLTHVAGASLPSGQTWGGRSFLPQLMGDKGNPRDWIYIHGGGHPNPMEKEMGEFYEQGQMVRYVRGNRYKLFGDGRFYDMQKDIWETNIIELGTGSEQAEAQRKEMQSILNTYEPYVDKEEATHAERVETDTFDLSTLPPPIDTNFVITTGGSPRVSIRHPQSGSHYFIFDTIPVRAEAHDFDGIVDSVAFFANGSPFGISTEKPFEADLIRTAVSEQEVVAVAYDDSGNTDTSFSVKLNINGYMDPVDPGEVRQGLLCHYYQGRWIYMPDFRNMEASWKDTVSQVSIDKRDRNDDYAFRYTGFLEIPVRGKYTLYSSECDGMSFYLNNRRLFYNYGRYYPASVEKSLLLEKGLYRFEFNLFTKSNLDSMIFSYSGPGIEKQKIPDSLFYRSVGSPPVVSILHPAGDTVINEGADIPVTLQVEDPDQDVGNYTLFINDEPVMNTNDYSFTLNAGLLSARRNTMLAKAYDLGGGMGTSDPLEITINAAPEVAFTSPAGGSEYTGLDTVQVQVAATDDNLKEVRLYVNEVLYTSLNLPPWSFQLSNMERGTKILKAMAVDSNDLESVAKLQIKIMNTPPVASIVKPENGSVFGVGQEIMLEAAVSDPDDDVYKVAFYEDNTQLGDDANIYYVTRIKSLPLGEHTLVAKAYDKEGAVSVSEPVTITIEDGTGIAISGTGSFGTGTQLSMYPNPPENDVLMIESDVFNNMDGCMVTITGAAGRIIYRKWVMVSDNVIQINLDPYVKAGIYQVNITSKTRKVTGKLMVQ